MRQGDSHPEPAGELRKRPDEVLLGETESGQDAFGFVLRILPVVRGVQHCGTWDVLEVLGEIADPQTRAFADPPTVQCLLAQNQS